MIKSLLVFPNHQKKGNQPDYIVKGRHEDGQESLELGGAWKKTWNKDGKEGTYLSIKLKDVFTKEDGEKLPGYIVISEEEYNILKDSALGTEPTTEEISPDQIPF